MSRQGSLADQEKKRLSSMEAYWNGSAGAPLQLQRGDAFGYIPSRRIVAHINGLPGNSASSPGTFVAAQQETEQRAPSWPNPSSTKTASRADSHPEMAESSPSETQNSAGQSPGPQSQLGHPPQLNSGTSAVSQDHTNVPFASTPTFPGNSRSASTVSDHFQATSSFEGSRIPSLSGHSIASRVEQPAAPGKQRQQHLGRSPSGFNTEDSKKNSEHNGFPDRRASGTGDFGSPGDESAAWMNTSGKAKRASADCGLESNLDSQGTLQTDGSSQHVRPEVSGRGSRKPTCFDLLYNDALMVKRHQEKIQTNENLKRKLDISKLEDERRECTFKPVTWSSRKPLAQQKACLIKMKQLADKQRDLKNAVYVLQQEEREIDDHIAKELQADIAAAYESENNEEVHKVLDFYRHLRAEETSRLRSLKLDLVSQVSRLEQQYKRTAATVNFVEADIAATVGFDLKLADQLHEEVREDIDAANSLRLGARFRMILEAVTTGQPLFPQNEKGVSLPFDAADSGYDRRQPSSAELARSLSRHRYTIRGDHFSRLQRQPSRPTSLGANGTPRFSSRSSADEEQEESQRGVLSNHARTPGSRWPANGGRRSTFGGDYLPHRFVGPTQQSLPAQMSPRFQSFQGNSPALRGVSGANPSAELRNSSLPGAFVEAASNAAGDVHTNTSLGLHHCGSPRGALAPINQAVGQLPAYTGARSSMKGFQMPEGFGAGLDNESALGSSSEGASPRVLTSWQKEKAKNELRHQLAAQHRDRQRSSLSTSQNGSTDAAPLGSAFFDKEEHGRIASAGGATPRKVPQPPPAVGPMRNTFSALPGYLPSQNPVAMQQAQMSLPIGSTPAAVASRQSQPLGNMSPSRFSSMWHGQLNESQVSGADGVTQSVPVNGAPNSLQNSASVNAMNAVGARYLKPMGFVNGGHTGNRGANAGGAVMVNRSVQPFPQTFERAAGGAQLQPPTMGSGACYPPMPTKPMAGTPGYPLWASQTSGSDPSNSYVYPTLAEMPTPTRSSMGPQDKSAPMSTEPNYPMSFQGIPASPQANGAFGPPPSNVPYQVPSTGTQFPQKGFPVHSGPFPSQPGMQQPHPGQQTPAGAPAPNLPRLAGGAVLKMGSNGHTPFADFAATAKQLQMRGMSGVQC
ncbi:conserved hypothetical protein [Neospora caninum Liverpool]|uniref:Uncharacterized protein n=1 Tax=Neospora caninum (strain Liverpool) TaxID=572307 RepID=F0VFU0_NEOCL|nr:conserved hypothetical protein [Neospora caninum Liverpool]CBZ52584.1 conserved hypothetical protein [Neospora caninum Liverpool]|eukprot:XP_003882616.1 conserved hypothetical protein [Neospora caninum Liverpool]